MDVKAPSLLPVEGRGGEGDLHLERVAYVRENFVGG